MYAVQVYGVQVTQCKHSSHIYVVHVYVYVLYISCVLFYYTVTQVLLSFCAIKNYFLTYLHVRCFKRAETTCTCGVQATANMYVIHVRRTRTLYMYAVHVS